MDVVDVDLRPGLGLHRLHRELGETLRAGTDDHLGQQLGEVRLQPDGTGTAPGLVGQPAAEDVRDALVGAVLQQPGEEQITGLQEREIGLVLHFGRGQQPGRLQIQQRRRDDQELRGLVQIPVRPHGPDVRHEFVGHLRQRDLGDVQLVLGDQLQKEVEGALEVLQPEGERAVAGPGGRPAGRGIRSVLGGARGGVRGDVVRWRRHIRCHRPRGGPAPERSAGAGRGGVVVGRRHRGRSMVLWSRAGGDGLVTGGTTRRGGRLSRGTRASADPGAAGPARRDVSAPFRHHGTPPSTATATGKRRHHGERPPRRHPVVPDRPRPTHAPGPGVSAPAAAAPECWRRRATPGRRGRRRPPRGRSGRGRRRDRAHRAAPAGRVRGP